jgi:hypothetical protein
MKIVFLDSDGSHNRWFNPLARVLAQKHEVGVVPTESAPVCGDGDLYFMWNRWQRIPTAIPLEKLHFMECGLFRQKDTMYLDSKGIDGSSRLSELTEADLSRYPVDLVLISRKRAEYLNLVNPNFGHTGYVFIPLQEDNDYAIKECSPFPEMQPFIDMVSEHIDFAPIIFKRHPNDHRDYLVRREQDLMVNNETSETLTYNSIGVVGINSTVLKEALFFSKPVVALGRGMTDNKGITHKDVPKGSMPEPCPKMNADRFLSFVLKHYQIPLSISEYSELRYNYTLNELGVE